MPENTVSQLTFLSISSLENSVVLIYVAIRFSSFSFSTYNIEILF